MKEKNKINKILAVSQNVLDECIRHKILNLLFLFAIALIGGALIIQELSPGSENRTLINAGYACMQIFGFLTVILSIFIFSFEEFEMKNIWLTLTKPISRTSYIIGKFLGVSFTLLLSISLMFILLLSISLVLAIHLNFNYLIATISIFLSLLVTIAFTILFTTISSNLITGIMFSVFIYLLGHLTEHLNALINNEAAAPFMKFILTIIYYLTPNLELFNLKDKIYLVEGTFDLFYLVKILAYSIIYISICLIISSSVFEKKEL